MIFQNDCPEVIAAKAKHWQRNKEFLFLTRLGKLIARADKCGLHRGKMARVLLAASQAMTGKGGTGGVGS